MLRAVSERGQDQPQCGDRGDDPFTAVLIPNPSLQSALSGLIGGSSTQTNQRLTLAQHTRRHIKERRLSTSAGGNYCFARSLQSQVREEGLQEGGG